MTSLRVGVISSIRVHNSLFEKKTHPNDDGRKYLGTAGRSTVATTHRLGTNLLGAIRENYSRVALFFYFFLHILYYIVLLIWMAVSFLDERRLSYGKQIVSTIGSHVLSGASPRQV